MIALKRNRSRRSAPLPCAEGVLYFLYLLAYYPLIRSFDRLIALQRPNIISFARHPHGVDWDLFV